MSHTHPDRDRGFTLIELLIVIVILGILAAVVVFAVGGISNRGEVSANAADKKTLETAQEAHFAQEGSYVSEQGLVDAGFLRDLSTLHDVTLTAGNADYTIVTQGSGGAAPTGTPTSFGGYSGVIFGSLPAPPLAVLIPGSASDIAAWNSFVAGVAPGDEALVPPLFLLTDPTFSGFPTIVDFGTAFADVQAALGLFPIAMTPASSEVGMLFVLNAVPAVPDPSAQWVDWDTTDIADLLSLAGY